ncbi:MAG: crossover junction endodeoxyribonuclease RuvC, partial [Phycisphaerae bacterium]|nr:crossover junction endodeoxyribonuclease RuvC [Phycisphaerae bacterium]
MGVDPGLQVTGYGVIEFADGRQRLLDAGVIRLNVRRPLPQRLLELERELSGLLAEHEPDVCAV